MGKVIFYIYRITAYWIDVLLLIILEYLLADYGIYGTAASLTLFFLYRYIMTAVFGATLGMMIFKLKLERYDFNICFIREISRFASEFYKIGYVYGLIDPYGRTLHDVAACTNTKIDKEVVPLRRDNIIKKAAYVLIIISVLKWGGNFILNEMGLIGLKRIYTSDEYFQSFDGDNLTSLSQDELYKKTLGRKYTALIDINSSPSLIRISNKLKYTEIYKLNLVNGGMRGEYLFKVPYPLQFICSGKFINVKDLCGISPTGRIVFVNDKGEVYGNEAISIQSVVTLRCGDVDGDGRDEAAILGSDGNIEIYKFDGGGIKKIYFGKFGEDIIPETFYINNGTFVFSKNDRGSIIYDYEFKNGKFLFKNKRYTKIKGVCSAIKTSKGIMISNVFRNAMTFKWGEIQRLEIYSIDEDVKRIYNFGNRPGRKYAYLVRSLEDVYDIDGDGDEEIILKAVGRDDVNGQGYKVEIYRFNESMLKLNGVLSKLQGVNK